MKEQIIERARQLGFDDCRFTTAEPPSHREEFRKWIASGQHGTMGYLERNAEKRVDPQLVLPGAKSLVMLAISYSGDQRSDPGKTSGLRGEIARYARHADYHDVLADRLKELTAAIQELGGPDTRSLWYIDTGPILERDAAQRAGLGFAGKHTNVISRRLGNWFFIAEILTTVEFAPDEPERNRCGTCSRCIEACPTEAIRGPFQLDARRCISYLTIELKGSIPVELRPAIGTRIYGCDACLEACPWNRFAREGAVMKQHARDDLREPDLLDLLSLDNEGFKTRFKATPMLRTKRRGLLRNVCVALGNIGTPAVIPALTVAAADPEPLIAEHAEWAIDQIKRRSEATTPSRES